MPAWLKYALDIGLTIVDLIAPFFISGAKQVQHQWK